MERRKNRQNEIEILIEDVELILGNSAGQLNQFLSTTFCAYCSNQTTVTNYQIFLDDVNDIIFAGHCIKCNNEVSRYIETGESTAMSAIAKHIREVKLYFKHT